MQIHEDIFGVRNAIGIIIRWHDTIIAEFDKRNSKTFEQLKTLIEGSELKCFFLKIKDNEQRILVPFDSQDFQLELYVEWDEKTFSYKARVKSNKKSRIIEPISLPEEEHYFIEETCKLTFINIAESKFPIKEQVELFERVSKLEILPKTKIENDKEIWEKWIEAQDLFLKRNAQPFKVRKNYPLLAIKNNSGDIIRYKFRVDLFVENSNEYKEIEEELLNEFHINESFDDEGNILLKFDDIFRGLDSVIHKKFNDKIERNKEIKTILKLKPLSYKERIEKYFSEAGYNIFCQELNNVKLLVRPLDIPFKILNSYLENNSYILKECIGKIEIINHGIDFTQNKDLFQKFKANFGNIPKPQENIFSLIKKTEDELSSSLKVLQNIFGIDSVMIAKSYIYNKISLQNNSLNEIQYFTEDFWNDIKRDIYNLDFKVETSETASTLSYYFETKEECFHKLKQLQAINKFQFLISPEQFDFKFKVKTNLLKNKTEKQIFIEKINDLNNVEFQIEISGKEDFKQKDYLSIGKLNAHESDLTSLVFSIPLRNKDEQKAAKKLIEFIEENNPINQVEPNLRGDQAKISWLLAAMKKITNPSERPNGKAVNNKLGQFIFDSSKAEEVFKDITPNSEEWNRVKQNQFLKLNDSQRHAILSALHARDLCLLQGPPGTGKTTVIAELIWQFISQSQEQKILLTSETNLAVDNAIEKLLNKEHTIVKPLRFGKDTKFEEEGKKYSFNRILKWIDEKFVPAEYEEDSLEEKDDDEEFIPDNPYNNAVQIWMNQIAEKSHKEVDQKYGDALKNWAIELTQPETKIKQLFKDKYFKYANVVGSTCSSAGSPSFMKSYQLIFNKKNDFLDDPSNRRYWIPIEFDSAIMDEASKATPPEILLPLCFAKKSIVIGDHKQLPPMLNEKEFKEALTELNDDRAKKLVEEIDKEFVETSQFERLIMNPKVSKSIVARLNIQYRMHPKINNVIRQFYTGETDEGLFPSPELIENADIEDLNNPFSRHHGFWNEGFIKPDIHSIWINVDGTEEKSGTSTVNEDEAKAIKTVLQYLRYSKGFDEYYSHWESIKNEDKRIQEQEIGIISFYGQQLGKFKELKKFAQHELGIMLRIKTVDKFQGMERNIIIVSTVRTDKWRMLSGEKSMWEAKLRKRLDVLTNEGNGKIIVRNNDIGFAKAPERLNVALSRARRLLIVVGNLDFFESYKDKNGDAIYKNAIDIIRKEGLIIDDYKKLNKYK